MFRRDSAAPSHYTHTNIKVQGHERNANTPCKLGYTALPAREGDGCVRTGGMLCTRLSPQSVHRLSVALARR